MSEVTKEHNLGVYYRINVLSSGCTVIHFSSGTGGQGQVILQKNQIVTWKFKNILNIFKGCKSI